MMFAVGSVAVLVLTFALGVVAGRHWPDGWSRSNPRTLTRASVVTRADRDAGAHRGLDKEKDGRGPEAAPPLTFYQELTAPLTPTSSFPPPKPSRPGPTDTSKSLGKKVTTFTVQVGAFKARAQAEALRAKLAEGGDDAVVVEGDSGGTLTYRVRVGSFETREAALDAASRLSAERHLATYVTAR